MRASGGLTIDLTPTRTADPWTTGMSTGLVLLLVIPLVPVTHADPVQETCGRVELPAGTCGTLAALPFLEEEKITAEEGATSDQFGASLAMYNGTLAVGAWLATVGTNFVHGAVLVYEQTDGAWTQTARLVAPHEERTRWFGQSVAIHGDTLVVGAGGTDVGDTGFRQGTAYVYHREHGAWDDGTRLVASDGTANDRFGQAVALHGDTMFVGAHAADIDGEHARGAAYVYARDGDDWVEKQKLVAEHGTPGQGFGQAIALLGSTAVIGAPNTQVGAEPGRGAAYVYTRDEDAWRLQDRLVTDGDAFDLFGGALALDGSRLLVGASGTRVDGQDSQGAAYLYRSHEGTWTQSTRLVASDGAAHDQFGWSLALHGDRAFIGAHAADVQGRSAQGAAYVFTQHEDDEWTQKARLTARDGASDDHFGQAVALGDETLFVSAHRADVAGNQDQGAVYTYRHLMDVLGGLL